MRVFWLIVGMLVVASGAVVLIGHGGETDGVVLEERALVSSAPGDGARLVVVGGEAGGGVEGGGAGGGAGGGDGRMMEKPWVMRRSGSANHEGHPARADVMSGSGLASLDALLGLENEGMGGVGEVDPELEAAGNKLLELLAVAALTGAGTEDDPYVVSWELLDTARLSYRPLDGLTEIPAEVARLDGSFVRIEGYFLAPFSLLGTDQLLLMRYVWDGCCIGVPPTAYSTVEIDLQEVVSRRVLSENRTLAVEGRFRIDPYESRDWLLSLFVMEGCRVVSRE